MAAGGERRLHRSKLSESVPRCSQVALREFTGRSEVMQVFEIEGRS